MSTVPSNLIRTRITQLPEYTGTDTLGYIPYVLSGVTYKVQYSQLPAAGNVNLSNPANVGVLPLVRGGTGSGNVVDAGAIIYSTGTSFLGSPAGVAGQILVSGGTSAPYWQSGVGLGSVTSVNVSGASTGLTFTGGPITTFGTITMGGTLALGYGGTGGTTAATARTNLSAAIRGTNNDITSFTALSAGISTPTFLQFSTATTPTTGVGRLSWNQTDGTLNLGVIGGNVTLQIGQEQLVRVVNKSGVALTDGQIVYLSGAQGNRVKVDLAIANGSTAVARTVLGIVTEPIPNNLEGFITISGLVRDLDTSAYVDGDILYLSATVAGGITNVRPTAPTHVVIVGYCVSANPSVGSIFVSVQPGYDLEDLSDVAITTPAIGQTLIYNSASQIWVNNTLTAGSGIAITNGNGTISIATSGFGTLATQNANAVAVTGGAIDGTTVGATAASSGKFTTLSATGVITSTLATGTAPFTIASTTNVANLNASSLNGATFAAPGAIGSGTASTGAFTTLTASTNINSTRINPRIGTTTGAASPITPTGDASDQYTVTALAVAATIAIPSGAPVDGQKLTLRIKDNGTARVLTWTTSAGGYRVVGTTLPTTTVISKTMYINCVYNSSDAFWDVIAVAQQA